MESVAKGRDQGAVIQVSNKKRLKRKAAVETCHVCHRSRATKIKLTLFDGTKPFPALLSKE